MSAKLEEDHKFVFFVDFVLAPEVFEDSRYHHKN